MYGPDASGGLEGDFYRCQATEIPRASTAVDWKEPTQYVREVTSGNVGVVHMARVMTRALLRQIGKKLRLIGELPLELAGTSRVDGERLDLQPGEWVEVRSPTEIGLTLDDDRAHRGLTFTYEMAQHCGGRFRVKRRVDRLIDEGTGRMLELKNDCIELEGLVCTGNRATYLWFCRRDLVPYWREAWLRRTARRARFPTERGPRRRDCRAPRRSDPAEPSRRLVSLVAVGGQGSAGINSASRSAGFAVP